MKSKGYDVQQAAEKQKTDQKDAMKHIDENGTSVEKQKKASLNVTDAGDAKGQHVNGVSSHNLSKSQALKSEPGIDAAEFTDLSVKVTSNGASVKDDEQAEDDGSRGCCGRQKKPKQQTIGIFQLFRYANPVDILMMVVGTLGAMITGCAQPFNMLQFGEAVNVFIRNMEPVNASSESNQTYGSRVNDDIQPLIINFVMTGVVALVAAYMGVSLWTWAGERQIKRIRKLFFRGVMRQDIGWFDTHQVGELNSRFSDDMYKIQEGLGDKVPVFIQWTCTWLFAYGVAFYSGWKLALAVIAFSPLFVLVAATVSRRMRTMAVKELKAYAKAGAVAEQALRAIRTVQAFQGQEKEQKKYEDNLVFAKKVGTRKGLVLGLGSGLFWTIIYVAFAVSFYYGVILIQSEGMDPGNVLVVFFGVLIGSMSLGHAFPNLESFTNARAAALKVFEIMDLRPVIDIFSTAGEKPSTLKGVIEFKDVHFRYPARPEVPVLRGLCLTVQPGQTVALVGASGCGKSTTVQLLQRFYDPEGGEVTVDGHNIKDLNLRWLREQIGVVNQEPVLFADTIAENIRYGNPDATDEVIKSASIEANSHNFIMALPLGYNTMVGERGAQLSGGQKQRIAIARALVKNPRILLLDEATSALDHESEAVVQSALEKAQEGRTTIVIAHRLSTVRNADKIVTISHGKKMEEGSHQELMARNGLYAQLVNLQLRAEEETGDSDIEIVEDDEVVLEESGDLDVKPEGTVSGRIVPVYRAISSESGKLVRHPSGRQATLHGKAVTTVDHKGKAEEEEDKEEKAEEEEQEPASAKRLIKLNAPEWPLVLIGTIMCVILGLSQPAFAFIFSDFLRVFAIEDEQEQRDQAAVLAGIMAAIGASLSILRATSSFCFGKAGAALTARLRSLVFSSMLKQDMSYFDHRDNQVGALSTKLAKDAAMVQGATGSKIGTALEACSTIVAALVIAFVSGWKLTFVILAFLPVMILAGKVQGRVVAGSAKSEKSQLQEAGKICSEAVDNIRTVVSLNREDVFIRKLENLITNTSSAGKRTAQVFGVTYGLSVSIQYFAFAAAFAYGTVLVGDGEMEFFQIFRVFTAIIMGGSSVGRNASFGLDYTKARVAAGRLFAIIDKIPLIDTNKAGKMLEKYTGRVELSNVEFHYPTRDTVRVLKGLSLGVEPGETLALVGSSGCGKSTVLQLLQRFYDTDSGAVLADGQDLKEMDLRWFRKQLGIVSQEPTLFDDSIAANIAYGDNSRQVAMDEIIAAARAANIHDFIRNLPLAYETNVGDKGTQMSGGQKQRIAIARALVRKPTVLLLDEATSALDSESERVVQDALDKAREGRTCIVIAHRLSTVQNADRIAVISEGRVQEMGSHSDLVSREGAYYRLLQAQNTGGRRPSSQQL